MFAVFFLVQTCGGVLSGAEGNFSSPLHPSFYPPAVDCKWTIKVCNIAFPPAPLHPKPLLPHPPLANERNAAAALEKPSCKVPPLSSSVRLLLQFFVCCWCVCSVRVSSCTRSPTACMGVFPNLSSSIHMGYGCMSWSVAGGVT